MLPEKVATYVRTYVPTYGRTNVAPTEHAARAFEEHELAARAWQALSKYPRERGTAARRFRAYAGEFESDLLLDALCEVAAGGYHAWMFTKQVARDRIIRHRELRREAEKREELAARPARGLRSIGDILGAT